VFISSLHTLKLLPMAGSVPFRATSHPVRLIPSSRKGNAFPSYTANNFRVERAFKSCGDAKKRSLLRSNWCWLRGSMGSSRESLSPNILSHHALVCSCIRSGLKRSSTNKIKREQNILFSYIKCQYQHTSKAETANKSRH
jgi:hypothetical protein